MNIRGILERITKLKKNLGIFRGDNNHNYHDSLMRFIVDCPHSYVKTQVNIQGQVCLPLHITV